MARYKMANGSNDIAPIFRQFENQHIVFLCIYLGRKQKYEVTFLSSLLFLQWALPVPEQSVKYTKELWLSL